MTYTRLTVPGQFGPLEYYVDTGPGGMDRIQARTVGHLFASELEILKVDITRDWRQRTRAGIERAAAGLRRGEIGGGQNTLSAYVGPSGWGKTDCGISSMYEEHVVKAKSGVFDAGRERDGSQDALELYRLFDPELNYHASLLTAYEQRGDFPPGFCGNFDDPPLTRTLDSLGPLKMAAAWLGESFEVQRALVQSAAVSAVRTFRFLSPEVVKFVQMPYHTVPGSHALVAVWAVVEGKRHPLGHRLVPPPEKLIRKNIDGLEVSRYDGPRWMELQEEIKRRDRVEVTGGVRRVRPETDLLLRVIGETPLGELERVIVSRPLMASFLESRLGGDVESVRRIVESWRRLLALTGRLSSVGRVRGNRLTEEDRREWLRVGLEGEAFPERPADRPAA